MGANLMPPSHIVYGSKAVVVKTKIFSFRFLAGGVGRKDWRVFFDVISLLCVLFGRLIILKATVTFCISLRFGIRKNRPWRIREGNKVHRNNRQWTTWTHSKDSTSMPVGRSCSGLLFRRNGVGKQGPWRCTNAWKMSECWGCEESADEVWRVEEGTRKNPL